METESLPFFTISNGRSLLKPMSENGHGQEKESLLPGPVERRPSNHSPRRGASSTSENLNHRWSSSPSVGRVLGNRRKNEQRFPNLPLHLFWPSVGGVIKKKLHSQPHLHEWFISARTSRTFMLQKKKL